MAELASHPAVCAWADVPAGSMPSAITCFKAERDGFQKSRVYRLHGAGVKGADIVAKRCSRATARLEQIIYERFLEKFDLSAPRLLGVTQDTAPEYSWLFLEDAGDCKFSRSSRAHAALAAEWLAELHASTEGANDPDIPDRGAKHFLQHVRDGRSRLEAHAAIETLPPEDREVLLRTIGLLDDVESVWDKVEASCAHMPRTLTHGDFKRGNVRIHITDDGNRLMVLDWEMAGFGPPAIDLHAFLFDDFGSIARLPPSVYAAAVRARWTGFEARDIRSAAAIGAIFRQIVSIDWASQSFTCESLERFISRFDVYANRLSETLRQLKRCG